MPINSKIVFILCLALPNCSLKKTDERRPDVSQVTDNSTSLIQPDVPDGEEDRPKTAEAAPEFPGSTTKTSPKLAWYDVSPLKVSMRSGFEARLRQTPGTKALDEFPLYELNVDLDSDRATFLLREKLWFTNTGATPLSHIVLRLYANAYKTSYSAENIPVRLMGGRCEDGPSCRVFSAGPSTIRVALDTPLPIGGRVRIGMEFLGRLSHIDSSRTNILSQGLEGLASMNTHGGGGDYGLLSMGDGIVSLANFFAVLAPRRNGDWVSKNQSTLGDLGSDEMSHVRAKIVTGSGMSIFTTGVPLKPAKTLSNNRTEHEVGAMLVRDFSILASEELVCLEQKQGSVKIRSCFLPADQAAGKRVLGAAVHSLAVFERHFGEYPYVDLDVVEAPLVGGAGGVEFAGLVTIASMLYRPIDAKNVSTKGLLGGDPRMLSSMQPMFDSMLEFVTAHEVAHQYWHGLVGSDSRSNPFGDEGLAQYSALLYMEDRYGKERAQKEAEMQVAMGYRLMRMMGQPDGPVDLPVHNFSTPVSYAGLVYGKGPLVYRELRQLLGDAAFFSTVKEYVNRYAFGMAPRRAIINMFEKKHAGAPALVSRWLDQSHGDEDIGQSGKGQMMNSLVPNGIPNDMNHSQEMKDLQQQLDSSGTGINLEQMMNDVGKLLDPQGSPTRTTPTEEDLLQLRKTLEAMQ